MAPVLLAAACVAAWAGGLVDWLELDRVIAARTELAATVAAHPLAAAAAYAAVYAGAVALSLPGGMVLSIAGGLLFGGPAGALLAVAAASLGSTVVFLVARSALGGGLTRRGGPGLARIAEGFRDNAFDFLLFLRLMPVFPFWLVNLAPALAGVGLRTYVAATVIGIIPGTLAYAYIGAGLDSLVAAQIAANPACAGGGPCALHLSPATLVTPEILIALTGLGVVALLPVAFRAWRRRR